MNTPHGTADDFLAAWNAVGQDARERALRPLLADRLRYVDPQLPAPLSGRDAYLRFARDFRAKYPDLLFATDGPVRVHHHFLELPWRLATSDGTTFSKGRFLAELDAGGRIVLLVAMPG